MNIPKLKGKIAERETSIPKLAGAMGYNAATLYRKFQKPESITIGDIQKMKDVLVLSDAEATEIFLN